LEESDNSGRKLVERPKRPLYAPFVIGIILAFSALLFSGGSASARDPVGADDPEIILTLPAYPIKIYTGPGEDGTTSIKVPLTIVKPLEATTDTLTLSLWSVTKEDDLQVTIDPEEVVFPPDGNRSRDFEIDMELYYDPLYKISYIIGQFQIEGQWRYTTLPKNGRMVPESGEAEIVPFLMTETISKGGTDSLEGEVGEWKDVIIEVKNRGNAQVSIAVDVVGAPDDIEFHVNTPTLVINPFANETAYLKVRQATGKGRDTTINVRLTTKYVEKKETDDVSIDLHTETKKETVVSNPVFVITGIFLVLGGLLAVTIIVFIKERRSKR